MKIVTIDDETRALNMINIVLSEVSDVEITQSFTSSVKALEYIKCNPVDAVFVDIEMPDMNGIDLATALLELPEIPQVIFVTGYKEYALKAWGVHATDYILKPYDPEDIKDAISRVKRIVKTDTKHSVEIACFPIFSIRINGNVLKISNDKERELLAYLVHHRGAWVSKEHILAALFEDNAEASRSYYNTLLYRLRKTLAESGVNDLIQTDYGKCCINTQLIDCDYYRYLKGEQYLYHGEYLSEFSWSEELFCR